MAKVMTKEEKIDLGKVLDSYRIKCVFYTEGGHYKVGVYHVLLRNDDDELVQENIRGEDLG